MPASAQNGVNPQADCPRLLRVFRDTNRLARRRMSELCMMEFYDEILAEANDAPGDKEVFRSNHRANFVTRRSGELP